MKYNKIFAIIMAMTLSATAYAETETEKGATESPMEDAISKLDMENGVIPIADNRGFTLQSKDGNFVFSQGPGTTLHFAYALVEFLGGDANKLREAMLYNKVLAA